MRIAICDDEPVFAAKVKDLIHQLPGYCHSWTIRTFYSGDQLLFAYEAQRHPFDIVILDIQMAGTDGLATGLGIRQKDSAAVIVFLTAYGQYSLAAYDTFPLYYMVKPLVTEQFFFVLTKACRLVKTRREESIFIRSKEVERFLPISAISYLESFQHDVLIHTTEGQTLNCHASLKSLLTRIDKPHFIRIHKSYAANLYEAESFHPPDRQLLMKNHLLLPVSRKQLRLVSERFVQVHTHVDTL